MRQLDNTTPRFVWRSRLVAVCIALTALAFSQKSGRIVADTKLDLTVDPGGFLAKSLHLWDPSAAFGQLQNQAYGYLFPMGPFFWLGDALGLPDWVTQRMWWSLLLCVAFLGMWRLSAALVVASPWARMAGSVAYALSPRILSELTITSIEVWPMAVAPWVLWPLVHRAPRTWLWRITRSALAIACLGGVNAVASGAALVLPALWFVTRRPSWEVLRWGMAWSVACLAAIAWWLGPLLVLGRYSPPFLDWIEGISVTSSTASVFEALRGTSAWLGFLVTQAGPSWPGGFVYVTQPALIMVTVVFVAVGLIGLGVKGHVREPLFLILAIIVGLILLTAGHQGGSSSVLSSTARDVLDGALAALRNLHKFDLVVRIPLSLGLIAGIEKGAAWADRSKLVPAVVPATVVLTVTALAAPALVGQLARAETYAHIPDYWTEAASWLDDQPDSGAVLMVPATSFADFEWGSTKDNPLQPLLNRPFVHRDGVPLGSAGATRFLDGVESELGSGQGGAYLQGVLATAGIRYVLVPNDLRPDVAGDQLIRVHSALEKSGLPRVATFGPEQSPWSESEVHTLNYRTILERPRIEVFEVPLPHQSVWTLEDLGRIRSAAPENLVALSRFSGRLSGLFDGDAENLSLGKPMILLDGRTSREVDFGRVAQNRSHLLADGEATRQRRPVTDYIVANDWPRTTQGWDGVSGVDASSSASDAGATLRLGPGFGPASAIDGDPETSWISGRFGDAAEEWLRFEFAELTRLGHVAVRVAAHPSLGASPTSIVIETDMDRFETPVFPNGMAEVLIDSPPTKSLRILPGSFTPGHRNGFGLAEVNVAGHLLGPRTVVPGSGQPSEMVFHRDLPGTPGCVTVDGLTRCNPLVDAAMEEQGALRRRFDLGEGSTVLATGWVQPRPGKALGDLLRHPGGIRAEASSELIPGVATRAEAAVDGNQGTAWIAGDSDQEPTLTLRLPERRTIQGIRLSAPEAQAASTPSRVALRFDDGSNIHASLDEDGALSFTPRSVSRVTLAVVETRPMISTDAATGIRSVVPAGIAEVEFVGAEDLNVALPDSGTSGAPCGFGPQLVVNGVRYPTRVEGSIADIRTGDPLKWAQCTSTPITLQAGSNVLDLVGTDQFSPVSVRLRAPSDQRMTTHFAPSAQQPVSDQPSPTSMELKLPPAHDARVVSLPQNFNEGWVARAQDGSALESTRLNGWMQAWIVPPGVDSLSVRFMPQRTYVVGLSVGVFSLLVLLGTAARSAGPRQSRRSFSPISISTTGVVVAMLLLFLVLGGWLALAIAAGVLLGASIARTKKWGLTLLRCAVVASLTAAAIRVSANPWPDGQANVSDVAVAGLCLAALGIAALLAVHPGQSERRGRDSHEHEPSKASPVHRS